MAVTTIVATEIQEHRRFLLDHTMACPAPAINLEATEARKDTATVSLETTVEPITIFIRYSKITLRAIMLVIQLCMVQITFISLTSEIKPDTPDTWSVAV